VASLPDYIWRCRCRRRDLNVAASAGFSGISQR
jgi:hypothetical protein